MNIKYEIKRLQNITDSATNASTPTEKSFSYGEMLAHLESLLQEFEDQEASK